MSYINQQEAGKPAGLSAALLVNGGIFAALAMSSVAIQMPPQTPPPTGHPIEVNPAPKDVHKPPEAKMPPPTQIDRAPPPFAPDKPIDSRPLPPIEDIGPVNGATGEGADTAPAPPVEDQMENTPPPLVFISAKRDPKYLSAFQPLYPTRLIQREIEGSAKIRVLIDTAGRVRQASVVSATHPAFGKAAVKQARAKWRFLPAMRGDEKVEEWQTLTILFRLDD